MKVSSVKRQIVDEQVPTNHQEKRSSSQIARKPSSSSPFCSLCKKYYKTHVGLYKHRRTQHPDLIKSIKSIVCREPNCDFRCKTVADLRNHLCSHGLEIKTNVKDFKNKEGK